MMKGETPTINGDGTTSRDFTFVDNAVQANLLACHAPAKYATGRVFNVGTGRSHTLNELYRALANILNFTEQPTYGSVREGDVQHSLAGIDRARRELNYRPDQDFYAGLIKTVEWYLRESATAVNLYSCA